jgi:hypothetical protein
MITMPAPFTHTHPDRDIRPEPPAAGGTGTPSWAGRLPARPPIDVRQLRHPAEPPRFAFAAAASILLIGLGLLLVARLAGLFWLAGSGAVLLLALGSFWCLVQVYRARLLGGAARVTPGTFPALSAAAAEVKRKLGYARPVEIFVAHAGDPVLLTSFLGTHVLVMNGDLVADLIKPGNRAQLDFILAACFGKLKARTLAWAPARIAVDALQVLRVPNFLVAPWERATAYTGDQVAATCCGSLDQSVIALNRLLVGQDLAGSVGMTGLMYQAVTVRIRWLPRLQQLYSRDPLLTDRYLNLLSFAGQWAPDEARAFRASLKRGTQLDIAEILARSARRRQRGTRRWVLPVSVAASAAVVGVAAFGLFAPVSQPLVRDLQRAWSTRPAAAMTPQPGHSGPGSPGPASSAPGSSAPGSSPPGSPAPNFPQTPSDAVASLEAHVPSAFAGSCAASVPPAVTTGLIAAVACVPTGSGAPAHVEYYEYANGTDMNAAFSHYAGRIPGSGRCDQGGQGGTYQFAHGSAEGSWACYYDSTGTSQMIWTNSALNILAAANARARTPQQLNDWFFSPAPAGPR